MGTCQSSLIRSNREEWDLRAIAPEVYKGLYLNCFTELRNTVGENQEDQPLTTEKS